MKNLLVLDIDGVLNDGNKLYFYHEGKVRKLKEFKDRDLAAMKAFSTSWNYLKAVRFNLGKCFTISFRMTAAKIFRPVL
jgi:3-deoxy-D-manno-octulosonate 8-phosphate phosphatase KdsC-like HAD superfamily phosphatase